LIRRTLIDGSFYACFGFIHPSYRIMCSSERYIPVKHAIKTAIAAVLTIVIYQSFNIPEGYWAAISAVIVMQANLGGSLSTSWNRLLGSAIGATVGAAWVVILGRNP
jgi:uncharacterized membrane protein YccC